MATCAHILLGLSLGGTVYRDRISVSMLDILNGRFVDYRLIVRRRLTRRPAHDGANGASDYDPLDSMLVLFSRF